VDAEVRFHVRRSPSPACIGRIGLYVRYIVRSTFKQKALSKGRRTLENQGAPGVMAIWRIIDRKWVAPGRQKRNATLFNMAAGFDLQPAARVMAPSAATLVLANKAWRAGRPERSGDGSGTDG
jgi:hypothetical protein